MPEIKAIGKGSIASALDVLMTIIMVLGWIVFIFCAVLLGGFIVADLVGGEMQAAVLRVSQQAPLGTLLVACGILFVVCIGFIMMASTLKQILQTLIDGDPFVPENANRLTRLALIVAGMELCRHGIGFAVIATGTQTTVNFAVNIAAWVAVIVLMVLSQVFAEGTRLREEEKMTI